MKPLKAWDVCFEVFQLFSNLTGGSTPVLPSRLSVFKGIGVYFPNYTHAVVKRRKICCQTFTSRKTDYSRCSCELPVQFLGCFWPPGNCLWTALVMWGSSMLWYRPSNGWMWNCYSFQPVGPWVGYPFTDLGAEGCCRSLNALFTLCLHPADNLFGILKGVGCYLSAVYSHIIYFPFFFLQILMRIWSRFWRRWAVVLEPANKGS